MDGADRAHSLAWSVESASPAVQSRAPDEVVDAAQLGVEGAGQNEARAVGVSGVDGALPPGVPGNAAFQATA